jgi:hypothetical protein
MCGIDIRKLRTMPVESALKLGSMDFAAGKRHGLENTLVPERGFLIWLFRWAPALAGIVIVGFVLVSHKK